MRCLVYVTMKLEMEAQSVNGAVARAAEVVKNSLKFDPTLFDMRIYGESGQVGEGPLSHIEPKVRFHR